MNARQLLLLTADFIEQHPDQYDYWSIFVPEKDKCGCLIGIAGRLSGVKAGASVNQVCRDVLGIADKDFYLKMTGLIGYHWTVSPSAAVQGLRLYAESLEAPWRKFRASLALSPRTVLPDEVSEECR